MKMYKLVFIAFLTTTNLCFGQSVIERQIEIFASTAVSGTEFQIEIVIDQDSTKLKFRIRDSISIKLDNDSNYNAIRNYLLSLKTLDINNDTVLVHLNTLKSIAEKYTFYSADSITIQNLANGDYLNLINEVFLSTTDSLENKILNKNRITLDGTSLTFTFIDKDIKRKIYARSPSKESHPLLYKLVTSSTSLYRLVKKNDFLNRRVFLRY